MFFYKKYNYFNKNILNIWDIIISLLCILIILLIFFPIEKKNFFFYKNFSLSLNILNLVFYLFNTLKRIIIALIFSILFSIFCGYYLAKNKYIEKLMIPIIDILQSVPIISFLSISLIFFTKYFSNPYTCASSVSIFSIFISQVWNILLSFYQSLKSIPNDIHEVAYIFKLSKWQKLWRIEIPFAIPGLLWNIMCSISNSWLFIVASENIIINNKKINLYGIGSYISNAINKKNNYAICYSLLLLFITILVFDFIIFKPLIFWSKKFDYHLYEKNFYSVETPLFTKILRKTQFFAKILNIFSNITDIIINIKINKNIILFKKMYFFKQYNKKKWIKSILYYIYYIIIFYAIIYILYKNMKFSLLLELIYMLYLGFLTTMRIMISILISCVIWIPCGVFIGLNAKIRNFFQPLIQFFSSFPANILYPILTILFFHININNNIYSCMLIVMNIQWYILFNIILGISKISEDVISVTKIFHIKKWSILWWKKIIFPVIYPFCITGIVSASGSAWNISIISEYMHWGKNNIVINGIGSYIMMHAYNNNINSLLYGTFIICIYVLLINNFIWKKLYIKSIEKL